MIIRLILLLGLAAVGWLVFLRRNRLPFHIMLVFALLGAGGVAVVLPEATNDIAHALGVGRGADLILYVSIVAILFVLVHYYTKFVELQQQITQLTRELAIARAEADTAMAAAPKKVASADG